jgi:putative ABC transport system substrate-binding protein
MALIGAAAACPVPAHAQARAAPTIGFLDPRPSPDSFADQMRGFHRGLKETGYVEGENVLIEYWWANNQFERLPALAAEMVGRPLAVIVASGGSHVARVAKAATTTIPIVFIVAEDPVKLGVVNSLARPGGNLTGINYFSVELYAKRLEHLRMLVPGATRVALLVNPADAPTMEPTLREVISAAHAAGMQVQVVNAGSSREIDEAFATLVRERSEVLYVGGDAFLHSRRIQIAALALRNAIPATYPQREWVEAGGLMSYGVNFPDIYRQMGIYTGRILKGEKPADLPIIQPTRFDFIINLGSANALGLTIPPNLLALADEVIE